MQSTYRIDRHSRMRTPDEFLIVGYSHAAAAVARKETYKYNVVVEST